ncbi:MAG: short-chain fatty acyl-CoA regulator family protein [Rhodospirillum sp.]|nr:short-chain fatty acyl-CoA regulator family protein [Rhodospirillum sp.]MCF8491041.1 short-chain fatty acyl-CoA regulator family protein [Rhodospirillum sp.]MCF8500364.1 short-chain fatty acyl-CoA regulator family protein [Rhodospirillum sp.]
MSELGKSGQSGSILGTRIRQRRRELGIRQSDLAGRIGISASYLNLIEWNKRKVAGSVLRRTADALDLTLEELDGAAERRLAGTLIEIAHLPSLSGSGVEEGRIDELIGRFPGWARGIDALARAEQDATARAAILSDRLSNDPFLGEAIHRMLTRIAAVRSAAEILTDYSDIPPDRRDRFMGIINEESRALSDAGEALVTYLDKAEDTDRVMTPLDEVEALFEAHGNRFDAIEKAGGEVGGRLADSLTDSLPLSRAQRARTLVERHMKGVIERVAGVGDAIRTAPGRHRARRALTDYALGAVLLPMGLFAPRAKDLKYDVEALADLFSVEVETVCHRLTALSPEGGHPRFGYYRANAAGTIIEMLGLSGLALPRYAAACPLWVLYRAQQSPEAVIRQCAVFPSGARYVFIARARSAGPTGFGRPRHYLTDMVAMTETESRRTVYGPDPSARVDEVGPSCRLCPRASCIHRVEDPLLD